jgi:toxin YoeB
MAEYQLEFKDQALADLKVHSKVGDKATIGKIDKILDELEKHPYTGTAKPEPLKGDLKGFWSRRINHQDRMIYSVNDKAVTVVIVSAIGHYFDK